MPVVNITAQGFEWLKRNVSRTAKRYQALPENEARKEERTIKHWSDMSKRLNSTELEFNKDATAQLIMKRVELRSLQNMTLEQMVVLQSKVLPEYKDRVSRIPEKQEFYQEYVEKAEALYKGLAELLEAINFAISRGR